MPASKAVVQKKEQNDRLERIRLGWDSYQHYRDSLIQQRDFCLTVAAAEKALDLINLALKDATRLLPALQEVALAHTVNNADAERTFRSAKQEEQLPEIAQGVKELSAKLESLLGDVSSLNQLFWPFVEGVAQLDEQTSALGF